jgi:hypothetical protein
MGTSTLLDLYSLASCLVAKNRSLGLRPLVLFLTTQLEALAYKSNDYLSPYFNCFVVYYEMHFICKLYWHHQLCVKLRLLMAVSIEDQQQSNMSFSNFDQVVFLLIFRQRQLVFYRTTENTKHLSGVIRLILSM